MQGYEDKYMSGTCRELLKWKFAHLNSVDFVLDVDDRGRACPASQQPDGYEMDIPCLQENLMRPCNALLVACPCQRNNADAADMRTWLQLYCICWPTQLHLDAQLSQPLPVHAPLPCH